MFAERERHANKVPLPQTATCLYYDEETNMSEKMVVQSVRQQLARDTTWEKVLCKTLQGRK